MEGLHFLNDCLRKCDCGMWKAVRILDPTKLRVPPEARDLAASPGKEERVQEICGWGWDVVRSIWEARAQSEPPWESTRIFSPLKSCLHPGTWDWEHILWCTHCLVEAQLECPADAQRSSDTWASLVKDECQWKEESQADPSLMGQPLDVVGKSEVLGGPQEACADDRVCLCPPGPDTPENASCCWVDARSALAVLTPGGGAGGDKCTMSGCP